jgi:GTP-binding protein HflX
MTTRRPVSNERPRERAALVSLVRRVRRQVDPDSTLDELAGLARAAGAEVLLRFVQEREDPDPATFIGKGKAEQLARAADEAKCDVVIVDNNLSPAQARNLEKVTRRRVIDRTELILDIFAHRARTREGKLQVELAQLQYLLPRLAGSSEALSRLGGGIGTKGPGETKLETDRRRIRHRISVLKQEIEEVQRRRGYLRARRRRTDVPTVALVGYTNAGKTTLFNRLTGASAVASDALFVTLDPLMRRMKLPDARQIILADTVGFIDRLPHQLVAAFHATLEEVAAADLLLHVIDASSLDRSRHIDAVRTVLTDVGAGTVPSIDVYNKIDALSDDERVALAAARPQAFLLSAQTGDGRDRLVAELSKRLSMDAERMQLRFDDRSDADRQLVADLYRHAAVLSHVTASERVTIEADVPRRLLGRFSRAKVSA